jgi:hypothetical protein
MHRWMMRDNCTRFWTKSLIIKSIIQLCQYEMVWFANPIEDAQFAVVNHLMEEAAYKWWVHKVLWKWNRIIS